jgi:anti-sigma factor RsiW
MARCQSVSEQLTAWADGQLGSFTRARVDKHLRQCASCAAAAQATQQTVRAQSAGL